MSTTTKNLKLIKPELTDTADITAMNQNWDEIDEHLTDADKRLKRLEQIDPNSFTVSETYTATLPTSGWVYSSTKGYSQTVVIAGILATDNPIVDVVLGENRNTNNSILTAWEKITRIVTADNSITVYAEWNRPSYEITLQLKVVR